MRLTKMQDAFLGEAIEPLPNLLPELTKRDYSHSIVEGGLELMS